MVDSWCHTWSQWGTNPRIGWCAWSWWLPLLRSHPLAPRLLGRESRKPTNVAKFLHSVHWIYSSNIHLETMVFLIGVEETSGWNMSWQLEDEKHSGFFPQMEGLASNKSRLKCQKMNVPQLFKRSSRNMNYLPRFLAIWVWKMFLESTEYPMVSPKFGPTPRW